MRRRAFIARSPAILALCIASAAPAFAQHQDYPDRAVTIVAPAAPGGL